MNTEEPLTSPAIAPPPLGPPLPYEAPQSPFPQRTEKPVARLSELALLLGAAFLLNIVARTQVQSLAMSLAVVAIGSALFFGGRLQQRSSQLLVAAAMALSPWFFVRAAGGLTAATFVAIAGLLALGAGLSRTGDLRNLKGAVMVQHAVAHAVEWLYGLAMVQRLVGDRGVGTRWSSVARGVMLAAPVVLVFGLLLGSADRVFANVLLVDDVPNSIGHIVLTIVLAIPLLGLLSHAAHKTEPTEVAVPRRLVSTEVTVVLGSVCLLFLAFVVTQVVVAMGGVEHVLETEGLTQAEHARRGFFQLLWVAALTLVLLGAIRSLRRIDDAAGRDRFRTLAIAILGLTLVITAISVQRLLFYVDAFGLTPLRFWVLASAGWIGLVILGYLASVAGLGRPTSWFPGFMVVSAFVFVLGLNITNPDQAVARYNLNNTPQEAELDIAELASLSTDAIAETLPTLRENAGNPNLSYVLCRPPSFDFGYGWLGANLSQERAEKHLAMLCNP